jgi:WhiB family redox-sensing transcriptional regulator
LALPAEPTDDPGDWRELAACRGATANFFPARGQPTGPIKAICAACPVVAECAEAGLFEKHGIWGGMSERERRRIRRQRRKA